MHGEKNRIKVKLITALSLLIVLVIGIGVLYKVSRYPSELTKVSKDQKTFGKHEVQKSKSDDFYKVYHYPSGKIKSMNQWIQEEMKANDQVLESKLKENGKTFIKQDYKTNEIDGKVSVLLKLELDGKPVKEVARTFDLKEDKELVLGDLFDETGQNIISTHLRNNFEQKELSRNEYLSKFSAQKFNNFYIDNDDIITKDDDHEYVIKIEDTLTYLKKDLGSHKVSDAPSPSVYLDQGVDPNEKLIAFTFDDGPHWEITEKLMDTLEAHDGKGTFFMVGQRIEQDEAYKPIVKSVLDRGHQLANHSYDHADFNTLTKEQVNAQIDKTSAIFKDASGYEGPYMVRPPYGNANEFVRKNTNSVFINWSVDTLDWKTRDPQSICNEIDKMSHDGAIILLHDLYETSYKGFECGIKKLADKGYKFVTVEELLKARNIAYETGEIYTWGPKQD